MKPNDKLTTQDYWEGYYKRNHVSKQQIINVCSYYDEFWDAFIGSDSKDKSIIEIGGFPGRYLAYLSSKYDLIPTCLDYNSNIEQLEANFKVMDVDNYHILQEDFTKFKPNQQYDFVISNGFIEHFNDFEKILDLHIQYLKPNGKLYVMIPNKRGYVKFYQYLVDYKNLKLHNLKSMKLKVFRDFAKRNDLITKTLIYHGEFPHIVHQKLNIVQKVIYEVHRRLFKKVFNKLVKKYPSKLFSSRIIAMYERAK